MRDPRVRAGMWECQARVGEKLADVCFRIYPAGDATPPAMAALVTMFRHQIGGFVERLGGEDGTASSRT
jgi:hypothetical protein